MKILNRDIIKYVAILLMLLDHIIQTFDICSGMTYEALDSLTHFTYITMSFFLVEGFYYTSSRDKYAKRLFTFGLLTQIPYMMTFSGDAVLSICSLNIFFTLGIGLLMITKIDSTDSTFRKVMYAILGIAASTICDWSFFGAIFTLLFYWAGKDKKKLILAYCSDILLFNLLYTSGYIVNGEFKNMLTYFAIGSIGFILSALCILLFYNGKKSQRFTKFNKWFFYIFYPGHLLVIGIIRILNLPFYQ